MKQNVKITFQNDIFPVIICTIFEMKYTNQNMLLRILRLKTWV